MEDIPCAAAQAPELAFVTVDRHPSKENEHGIS